MFQLGKTISSYITVSSNVVKGPLA